MADIQPDNIRPAWKLPFEGAWPTAVALAPAQRRVVAGNQDGALVVWELPETPVPAKIKDERGKEVDGFETPPPARLLAGHTNGITRLVRLPEGKTVVSSSLDKTLRVWDLDKAPSGEGEIVIDRRAREEAARRAKEEERTAILEAPGIKLPIVEPVATLAEHEDWINALALSRDGRRLISGDDRGLVNVWDTSTWQKVSSWRAPGVAWVVGVALSPDGSLALVSQYRRKGGDHNNYPAGLRIYNVADGSVKLDILATMYPKEKNPPYQYQYQYHKFVAEGLAATDWSPDGKLLAVGQGGEGGDGKVHLIDAEKGELVRDVSGHQYGVTDVAFSRDGEHLYTVGRDTTLRIIRVADGQELAKVGQPRGGQFTDWLSALSLSPDEKWIAAADISGHVQLWQRT